MKNLTKMTAATLLCLLLSLAATAQENPDARYLEGAVPEVNGKVVFSHEYTLEGMTQDEIFDRTLAWMEKRLKENENNSRILFTDKEKGIIVGLDEEWIVFKQKALSLDRTFVSCQLTIACQPGLCRFDIEKVRYEYREGEEEYTAEEWITDKYALNKTKTKLVRGLAKWRRKTVDFVDGHFARLGEALGASAAPTARPVETAAAPAQQPAARPATARELEPGELTADMMPASSGKLVIAIGTDPFNQTVMTANSGGSVGKVEGKAVVFAILSPDQPHEALDQASEYTIRFYPNGATQPSLELQCRKMPSPEALEGMPRTYVGEIIKATAFQ